MFRYRLKTPPMAAQVLFFASPKPGLRIFSAFQEHTEISIAQTLLGEFDVEMANTRKVLDRAPLEKADWKPHPKSGSLGWAAGHVANLPGWVTFTLNSSKLPRDKAVESKRELMETFEKQSKGSPRGHRECERFTMGRRMSVNRGGQTLFAMPRAAVVGSFVLHHLRHHRGPLTVHMRPDRCSPFRDGMGRAPTRSSAGVSGGLAADH